MKTHLLDSLAMKTKKKRHETAISFYGSKAWKSECDKAHAWNIAILQKAKNLLSNPPQ